ncbi:MAG: nucleotidyltransferase domain-containing protein [Opitutaceae bacterium]
MNKLAPLFYSEVRAELFRLLFGLRPKKMYRAEIIRFTRFAKGSVEEKLQKLVDLELLTTTKEHTLRFYCANETHPLYPELHSIVLKTVGLHDILKVALNSGSIEYAFVFGSLASLSENAASDVDLMVVGQIGRRELVTLLRGVAEQLGREVNSHIYGWDEISSRLAKQDHFLKDVLNKPKLFIKGDENGFTKALGIGLAPSTQDQP